MHVDKLLTHAFFWPIVLLSLSAPTHSSPWLPVVMVSGAQQWVD